MAAAHVEVWLSRADAIVLSSEIVSLPALQDQAGATELSAAMLVPSEG